ncbi:MAG: hypothetical protein ACREFD_13155 [Stellaceae bacterium]
MASGSSFPSIGVDIKTRKLSFDEGRGRPVKLTKGELPQDGGVAQHAPPMGDPT